MTISDYAIIIENVSPDASLEKLNYLTIESGDNNNIVIPLNVAKLKFQQKIIIKVAKEILDNATKYLFNAFIWVENKGGSSGHFAFDINPKEELDGVSKSAYHARIHYFPDPVYSDRDRGRSLPVFHVPRPCGHHIIEQAPLTLDATSISVE